MMVVAFCFIAITMYAWSACDLVSAGCPTFQCQNSRGTPEEPGPNPGAPLGQWSMCVQNGTARGNSEAPPCDANMQSGSELCGKLYTGANSSCPAYTDTCGSDVPVACSN